MKIPLSGIDAGSGGTTGTTQGFGCCAQRRTRQGTSLAWRTMVGELMRAISMRAAIWRMTRSSRTAKRPFRAWIRIERMTLMRRCDCGSSARHASRGVLWSFIFIPQCCHVILFARTMPSPIRPVDVSGGFQGLGGVFPDAPSIRCFPQVIESGLVSLLLQPVVHHVVDCRADLDAKSRPAGGKTRRIKGSGDSPVDRVSAHCTKCFRFDIRMRAGAACRQRAAVLCKGAKKISRDFPESGSPVVRRAFRIPPER